MVPSYLFTIKSVLQLYQTYNTFLTTSNVTARNNIINLQLDDNIVHRTQKRGTYNIVTTIALDGQNAFIINN